MTRDEMIEKLKRVQESCAGRDEVAALASVIAALRAPAVHDCEAWRLEGLGCAVCNKRAPAVTGEAAQHAETLRVMADDHATPDTDVRRQRRAACLAGAAALAAPPAAGAPRKLSADETEHLLLMGVSQDGTLALGEGAADRVLDHAKRLVSAAGAPPALVALVQEWQRTRMAWLQSVSRVGVEGDHGAAGQAFDVAVRNLLAWSPAPAPVAPPACSTCNGAGGERWQEPDGSENGEKCPECDGSGLAAPPVYVPVISMARVVYEVAPPTETSNVCGCGHAMSAHSGLLATRQRCHIDGCACEGWHQPAPPTVAQARDKMVEQLDQSGFFRPRPPAVAGGDAPPECPECDGDGYTEIGPIGDNFAMYQEACRACRATGRRRQEGQ